MGFANDVIGGAAALIRAAIKSPNYVPATSGWSINKDGSAEFSDLTVRGTFDGQDFILNSSGFFVYSGTPAHGNLIAAIAATAGTDQFSNIYPAGITSQENGFGTATTIFGSGMAFNFPSATPVQVDVNTNGLFVYATPGGQAGTLLVSLARSAGTDQFGNPYPQGLNCTAGTISGSTISGTTISGSTFTGTDFTLSSAGEFFYNGAFPGTPAVVQAKTFSAAASATVSGSLNAGTVAGNALCVAVMATGLSGLSVSSITFGGTALAFVSIGGDADIGTDLIWFYTLPGLPSGATAFALTLSGAPTEVDVLVCEVSGLGSSYGTTASDSYVAGVTFGEGNAVTAYASGAVTSTVPGFWLGAVMDNGPAATTPASWTIFNQSRGTMGYLAGTGTGRQFSGTFSSARTSLAGLCAFVPQGLIASIAAQSGADSSGYQYQPGVCVYTNAYAAGMPNGQLLQMYLQGIRFSVTGQFDPAQLWTPASGSAILLNSGRSTSGDADATVNLVAASQTGNSRPLAEVVSVFGTVADFMVSDGNLILNTAGGQILAPAGAGPFISGESWHSLTLSGAAASGNGVNGFWYQLRPNNQVFLIWDIKITSAAGTTIATLPSGYHPATEQNVMSGWYGTGPTAYNSGYAPHLDVKTTGAIVTQGTAGVTNFSMHGHCMLSLTK